MSGGSGAAKRVVPPILTALLGLILLAFSGIIGGAKAEAPTEVCKELGNKAYLPEMVKGSGQGLPDAPSATSGALRTVNGKRVYCIPKDASTPSSTTTVGATAVNTAGTTTPTSTKSATSTTTSVASPTLTKTPTSTPTPTATPTVTSTGTVATQTVTSTPTSTPTPSPTPTQASTPTPTPTAVCPTGPVEEFSVSGNMYPTLPQYASILFTPFKVVPGCQVVIEVGATSNPTPISSARLVIYPVGADAFMVTMQRVSGDGYDGVWRYTWVVPPGVTRCNGIDFILQNASTEQMDESDPNTPQTKYPAGQNILPFRYPF